MAMNTSVDERLTELERWQSDMHALLLAVDEQVAKLQSSIAECNSRNTLSHRSNADVSTVSALEGCDAVTVLDASLEELCVTQSSLQEHMQATSCPALWQHFDVEERLKSYPQPLQTLRTCRVAPSYCLSQAYTSRFARPRRKPWMLRQTPCPAAFYASLSNRISSMPMPTAPSAGYQPSSQTASRAPSPPPSGHAEHAEAAVGYEGVGSGNSPDGIVIAACSSGGDNPARPPAEPSSSSVQLARTNSTLPSDVADLPDFIAVTEDSVQDAMPPDSPLVYDASAPAGCAGHRTERELKAGGNTPPSVSSSSQGQAGVGSSAALRAHGTSSPFHSPSVSKRAQSPRLRAAIDHTRNVGFGLRQHTVYHCVAYDRTGTLLVADRRYNDFVLLRNVIQWQYPNLKDALPSLPEKRMLGKLQSAVVEQRRLGLQAFLQFIVSQPILQHDEDLVLKPWFLKAA